MLLTHFSHARPETSKMTARPFPLFTVSQFTVTQFTVPVITVYHVT